MFSLIILTNYREDVTEKEKNGHHPM